MKSQVIQKSLEQVQDIRINLVAAHYLQFFEKKLHTSRINSKTLTFASCRNYLKLFYTHSISNICKGFEDKRSKGVVLTKR